MSDLDYHLADGPCVGFHAVSGSASSDATGDLRQCRKCRFKQVSNAGPAYKTILNFRSQGLCQALQYLTICIKIFPYTLFPVGSRLITQRVRRFIGWLRLPWMLVKHLFRHLFLAKKVGEGGAEPGLREGDVARDRAGGGRVRSARVHASPAGS